MKLPPMTRNLGIATLKMESGNPLMAESRSAISTEMGGPYFHLSHVFIKYQCLLINWLICLFDELLLFVSLLLVFLLSLQQFYVISLFHPVM